MSELYGSDLSGKGFRISEAGRTTGPRMSGGSRMSEALVLFSDNSRAVEMWYEQNSGYLV